MPFINNAMACGCKTSPGFTDKWCRIPGLSAGCCEWKLMNWLSRWRDRYFCWACTLPEYKGCFWPCQSGGRLGMGCSRVSFALALTDGKSWSLVCQKWGRSPASLVRNLSSKHDTALPLNWSFKLSDLQHKEKSADNQYILGDFCIKDLSTLSLSNLRKYLKEKYHHLSQLLHSPFSCSSWQTFKSCLLTVSNCFDVV